MITRSWSSYMNYWTRHYQVSIGNTEESNGGYSDYVQIVILTTFQTKTHTLNKRWFADFLVDLVPYCMWVNWFLGKVWIEAAFTTQTTGKQLLSKMKEFPDDMIHMVTIRKIYPPLVFYIRVGTLQHVTLKTCDTSTSVQTFPSNPFWLQMFGD